MNWILKAPSTSINNAFQQLSFIFNSLTLKLKIYYVVLSVVYKIIILAKARRKLKTNPVVDAFNKMCLWKILSHLVPQFPPI